MGDYNEERGEEDELLNVLLESEVRHDERLAYFDVVVSHHEQQVALIREAIEKLAQVSADQQKILASLDQRMVDHDKVMERLATVVID